MKRERAYIPDDVIFSLLLRLPAKSILRFKSVCKSWSSLTSDPSFLQAHAVQSTPAVIITDCRADFEYSPDFTLHPVFSINDDGYGSRIMIKAARRPPTRAPVRFFLQASCDGLLCLRRDDAFISPIYDYICNPLTKEWIEIPEPSFRRGTICAFYYHPTMKEYRLLSHLLEGDVGYEMVTVGAKEWRQIECTFGGTPPPAPPCYIRPPVSMHGKLHWISSVYNNYDTIVDYLILVFDINHEKFGQLSLHKIYQGENPRWQTHLLELEGKLGVSIVASDMEMDLWILEDYEKEVWLKKYRINIQGIRRMPEEIMRRNTYFRPLVVSDAGEAVVSFYGDLVLYNLKYNTCFEIEGSNNMGDLYFLYKESLVRHDFFETGYQDMPFSLLHHMESSQDAADRNWFGL